MPEFDIEHDLKVLSDLLDVRPSIVEHTGCMQGVGQLNQVHFGGGPSERGVCLDDWLQPGIVEMFDLLLEVVPVYFYSSINWIFRNGKK